MKKCIALILTVCLVLSMTVTALAAGKPKITEQPESATTDEKGTVTFKIKASNIGGLTWRFVNPETGEEITGKNLPKKIKGVKVEGANKKTIKLKNVPQEMHGWTVYCHITGNGYQVDSDKVTLLVYGMGEVSAPAPNPEPELETVTVPDDNGTQTAEPAPAPAEDQATQTPADTSAAPADTGAAPAEEIPEDTTFTVRGENVTLYPMDAYGNRVEEEAATILTFEDNANVFVQANGDVKYWTVNGMRIEPSASVSAVSLRNVTSDLTISAALAGSTISETDVVHITCEGCTFTCSKANLKNVTEGNVPAGAPIVVVADSSDAASKGYSINGGSFEHAGEASFRLTVHEDTTIKTK